ncbi:hypothetical protein C7433_1033 [Pantoea sp. PNA 03-3]|nr:hypothetical protein C7433_1033 [Pantoea sp. PNA 03-3]
MDMNFFKSALKYNTPLTILSVLILYLLKPIFDNIQFISNNPTISLIFFLISINSVVLIILYTNKEKSTSQPSEPVSIQDNEIIGNKAKDINILSPGNIAGNKINDNEAEGDLNIGQGFKHGEK